VSEHDAADQMIIALAVHVSSRRIAALALIVSEDASSHCVEKDDQRQGVIPKYLSIKAIMTDWPRSEAGAPGMIRFKTNAYYEV